ncbi:16S rRNA (cytosine(1402)-N(4))-methyltransferase RsmH [Candidatus Microgenomates bacterium]|nr:MAG: 16S rRNA (cytosine(1402)-N(4))-methyltransferase RsmH [Candidatus Microgenomates bacterium]
MNNYHIPVLLKEVLDFLNIQDGQKYIDATLGGGGHSFEILKRGGRLLAIDVDQEAVDYVQENLKSQISNLKNIGKNLVLVRGNFKDIDKIAHLNGFDKVSGIVFDLGVSSHQLESKERGFSFLNDAPLDMRMDKDLGVRALDLINILTKGELYELFIKLGEEYNARAISDAILSARRIRPIETTGELAKIIASVSGKFSKIHPATKVFQALRIAVNDELNSLREALPKALELLEKNGLLLIISFHSLEDRIVKNEFIKFEKEGFGEILTKKPIVPSLEEINRNRRSRSSKLRVIKRI